MQSVPAVIMLILGLLTPGAPMQALLPSAPAIDLQALDAVVEAQMAKHALPGVALAVIEGGEIVYLQGYGSAGADRPMTPQTPMLIGTLPDYIQGFTKLGWTLTGRRQPEAQSPLLHEVQ